MHLIVVFCTVSCLYLCLFCVVSVSLPNFRWIKIYISLQTQWQLFVALVAKGRLRASGWKLLIVGRSDSWTVPDFRRTLKAATVDIIDMNCKHTYCTSTLTLTVHELNSRCKFNAVQNIWATRQVTKINCYNNNWAYWMCYWPGSYTPWGRKKEPIFFCVRLF